MTAEIVRLIDRAGVPASDAADLVSWARSWLDSIAEGNHGEVRSLTLLVETRDGKLGRAYQSIGCDDTVRVIGLLLTAAHRAMDGTGRLADVTP